MRSLSKYLSQSESTASLMDLGSVKSHLPLEFVEESTELSLEAKLLFKKGILHVVKSALQFHINESLQL